ncbi:aminoglycoside phosphotransferase family protein [Paenibacillus sp. GCM10012303]|uniref:aminoglycoside phosphotransferase family protein n=1 Tax=Paenibacillus sp. GCM10012303 TaxID=3317340 RepID=UPI003620EA6A
MDCSADRNVELRRLIEEAVACFISPDAVVLDLEEQPVHKGFSATDIYRHQVQVEYRNERLVTSYITKNASLKERRVLALLHRQGAAVPYSFSRDYEEDQSRYVCIQDVDYATDYGAVDAEQVLGQEFELLAHLHASNLGRRHELLWLPEADSGYISRMLRERWEPSWNRAVQDKDFAALFQSYIPDIQAAAQSIAGDLEPILNDASSHTLIHTDLHPGNVLVQNNTRIRYIDWEEAGYGSFYLDIPLRFTSLEKAEKYRMALEARGVSIDQDEFRQRYITASRYIGLRYMGWTFGSWRTDRHTLESMIQYMNMVLS